MHFLDAEMQFLNLVKYDQYIEKVISQKSGALWALEISIEH